MQANLYQHILDVYILNILGVSWDMAMGFRECGILLWLLVILKCFCGFWFDILFNFYAIWYCDKRSSQSIPLICFAIGQFV